jgi:hypothetical protein
MNNDKLDITKPMQTRDGKYKVELVADLRHIEGLDPGEVLIMRLIGSGGTSEIYTYYADGRLYDAEHDRDIVNAPPMHTRWVVWFRTPEGVEADMWGEKPTFVVGNPRCEGSPYTILHIQEITYTEQGNKDD